MRTAPTTMILALASSWLSLGLGSSQAGTLVPHRAVYDLTLEEGANAVESADGRIVVELTRPSCDTFTLDYRLVARFVTEGDYIVTDQQTKASENADGTEFSFETKTFVDASQISEARGTAETKGETTLVTFVEPQPDSFHIPPSAFPIQHTRRLIAAAKRGEFVYQSSVFDGDPEARKRMSSTAVIGEESVEPTHEAAVPGLRTGDPIEPIATLRHWRISESYFNTDSDADGRPQFETAYTLYENGISDDMTLVFSDYSLAGDITELELLTAPDCRQDAG